MDRTALICVLGAVAYGERKAYEGASAQADAAGDDEARRMWRTIAAEELRHHLGFVRRLEALGADPERAMRPYHASLDHFHAIPDEADPIAAAMVDLLGEGVAADLLTWLRRVADADTASFIDTVLADEMGHEARAAAELRRRIEAEPDGQRRAAAAGRRMLLRMALSGPGSGVRLAAFLRLGRPHGLLGALASGYVRRLDSVGAGPQSAVERLDPTGIVARVDPLGVHRSVAAA